jgi:pimeloyl-ACP methyl ester carboxylesterase
MLGLLIVLIGLVLTLYLIQRQFIYFPTRQDLAQAELEAKQRGLEPWLHEGQFIGWRAPYPDGNASGSVLVLHGNAGAAIHRTYFGNLFQSPELDARFDVYVLEYPGFGPRPGSPSEASLLQAADEAITQLQQDSHKPILLVGESLGTVVAAIAGSRKPEAVQGMLLVTPFPNLPALARRHYPWLPAWFLRDGFRADQALAAFPGPVAFLIAGQDTIAPPGLGQAFFNGCPGTKRLWVEADAGHNSIDYNPRHAIWREILAFVTTAAHSPGMGSDTSRKP